MLSSPPPPMPPPHRTLSDEQNETQYSLDLDALNLDDEPAGLDSPSVHRVVDNIRSDDIDGPTDFTVNLAKYFQGTPKKKPLPLWHKEQDMFDDESAHFLSNSSPNPSPRLDRTTQSTEGADDPTPRPDQSELERPKRPALQPTVEDYYSEMTPARPHSVHLTPEPAQRRSYSTSRLRESQNQRPSSPPTISSMRSPMPHFDSTPDQRSHAFHQELQKLRETNESLQNQLDAERALRQFQKIDRPSSRDHADGSELESLRSELYHLREHSHDQESRLKSLQADLDKARTAEKDALRLADDRAKELDQMHDTEDAEIHNLHVQLSQARDAERQTHNALDKIKDEIKSKDSQLSDIRSQLKQSQDNLRETEHDLQDLKKWNDGQHKAKHEELQRVQQELADTREQVQRSKDDYEEDLAVNRSKVDADVNSSSAEREKGLERTVSTLQSQLDDMRKNLQDKEQQLGDLKARLEDNASDENLEKQLHRAQDEIAVKNRAIQTAREEADSKAVEMTRALAQQLQQAKQRLDAQEAERGTSRADSILEQLETQLQKARDELVAVQNQHLSDKEAWAKADSEAQTSQANVYDQLKKEQEARRKADEEARALREEIDMLQHFNRMDERRQSSDINAVDQTAKLAETLRREMQALKVQLESQQRQHHEEVERLREAFTPPSADTSALAAVRAEHRRTVDLIEEGMASLRTSRDEQRLRVTELESSLTSTTASLQTTQSTLQESRNAAAESAAQLSQTQSQLQDTQSTLKQTQDQLQESTQQLQELHALNAEFDARLAETLKKREDVWRAKLRDAKSRAKELEDKIGVLEEERKTMARALMGFWGREEFGDNATAETIGKGVEEKEGQGQKFRYRFART